jgi:penicillin-binding protein 1C
VKRLHRWLLSLSVLALAFWLIPVASIDTSQSTVLFSDDGVLLGASLADDQQWRYPSSTPVPERYQLAALAFEDRRFRVHPGVDPIAIVRAALQNLRAGRVVSGASTLTMQTVRISRGSPPRTLTEKLIEAVLALRLEFATSKDEILSLYANNAPFGGNTVGIESAAWRYYGRASDSLSWSEAATLAVLPNSPSLIHPGRNRDLLQAKRDRVLRYLHQSGELSESDLSLALAEPLPAPPGSRAHRNLAPHLIARSAGVVKTTLSHRLQANASDVVQRHHRRLADAGIHNLAVLVAEVETGRVLAYVGNVPGMRDHGGYVDIVRARRSTGSILKPFLYAALLEAGELTPDQVVPDFPMRFGGFAPENYDRNYRGALPASEALARSRNLPAVWMLKRYGVDRFYGDLRRWGVTTLHRPAADYGLTLILGGAEGTLWNLVSVYRKLAWAAAAGGDTLPELHWSGQPQMVPSSISPAAAWLTVEALKGVWRPGALAGWEQFESPTNIAWKTGTSVGFRDGLALGITPQYVVGVWAGNSDGEGRPELTGHKAAAPVLFDLFALVQSENWFERPANGLDLVTLCAESGMRAGPHCTQTTVGWITTSASRSATCHHCQLIHCDVSCNERLTTACATLPEMHTETRFVLNPASEWFYRKEHPEYIPLPPWRQGCVPKSTDASMALVTPASKSQIYVPLELSGERGRVVFEATHRDDDAVIHWHLDDNYLGSTTQIHQLNANPPAGAHRLTLVDGSGARVSRRFSVIDRD